MIRKSGAEAARRAAHPSLGTAESPNYPTPEHVFFSLICLPPGFGRYHDGTLPHFHTTTLPHYRRGLAQIMDRAKFWRKPNPCRRQILDASTSSPPPNPRCLQILQILDAAKSSTPPRHHRFLAAAYNTTSNTGGLHLFASLTLAGPHRGQVPTSQ